MPNQILPEGSYTIANVGQAREWDFQGDDGQKIFMKSHSVQFQGHENIWVDVNKKSDSPVPQVGEVIEGRAEQDDAGKYNPRFKKTKKNGYRGGGGRSNSGGASAGAIWATSLQTASHIASGYFQFSDKKPASLEAYFDTVAVLAVSVNKKVDELSKGSTDTSASTQPAAQAQPQQAQTVDLTPPQLLQNQQPPAGNQVDLSGDINESDLSSF